MSASSRRFHFRKGPNLRIPPHPATLKSELVTSMHDSFRICKYTAKNYWELLPLDESLEFILTLEFRPRQALQPEARGFLQGFPARPIWVSCLRLHRFRGTVRDHQPCRIQYVFRKEIWVGIGRFDSSGPLQPCRMVGWASTFVLKASWDGSWYPSHAPLLKRERLNSIE